MKTFFIKFLKNIIFLFFRLVRMITNKFDKKISLYLSKSNWSSEIYVKGLEITTTVGCAMMCEYCPQESYKKNGKEYPRSINFEVFKNAIKNVDNSYIIHWTGFSEPLHAKDFPLMSKYLNQNGYKQHISTTMYGREESKEFMITENCFDSIMYHLPDDKNLMKLKVNDKYLKFLEKSITFQAKYLKKNKLNIMVIGDDFEPQVKKLINDLIQKKIISPKQIDIRKHLVTRANQIKHFDGFRTNENSIKSSEKDKLYYCGYGRLNKGVMLTNGSVAICCNDYSIEHNVGNLIDNNIIELYKHKKLFENDEFIRGNKSLCNRCEFYKFI